MMRKHSHKIYIDIDLGDLGLQDAEVIGEVIIVNGDTAYANIRSVIVRLFGPYDKVQKTTPVVAEFEALQFVRDQVKEDLKTELVEDFLRVPERKLEPEYYGDAG